jgi:MFS family permease
VRTGADRLVRAGVVLAVVGVAGQTVIHLVNLFALDYRHHHLDVSAEHTAFSWASTAATFAAACAALLLATRPRTHGRMRFALLGLLLAEFSLDDFIEIHERLGVWTEEALELPEAIGPRVWLLVYLPVLVSAALLLLWSALNAPPLSRRFQFLGIGLLVGAAFSEGLGVLTKLLEEHGTETPHRLRAALEEGLELGGWIILAAGLAAAFYEPVNDTAPSPDP